MSTNVFIRPDDQYARDINPIKHYVDQAALFLSIETGEPIESCRKYVQDFVKSPDSGVTNPVVLYIDTKDNGDKVDRATTLVDYIYSLVKDNDIVAPTMTTYVSSTIKKSVFSKFIDRNAKVRSAAKKEAFAAKAAGNTDLFIAKNNEQGNMKIYNNSLSGAFGSEGTSLCNPTAHSTLTSTTRTVSSIGNAINEKIISGNRHYRSYDIVLNNIVAIITLVDTVELGNVLAKYSLYLPNTDDVMECIKHSSDLYWINEKLMKKLRAFVNKLSPIQKAAFVYIGDLYHLRKHNDEFVRQFLTKLSCKETRVLEDPFSALKGIDEGVINYSAQICSEELRGLGTDKKKMHEKGVLTILASTAMNVVNVLGEYSDLITTLLASNTLPCSVAYIRSMVRRAVVLSDTDSTMFSIDEYVKWYFGHMKFGPDAFALASSVMFLSTESIANGLKILSSNITPDKEMLSVLSMKPEFSFTVFAQTSVAKHYFASVAVQEGNVFAKPDLEIKGVHLKSSATPPVLTKLAKEKMESILNAISNNERISLKKYLGDLADIERSITSSILNGETTYLKTGTIKDTEAYSGPLMQSPYMHYVLWNEVFEPKYGGVEAVPYSVVKIPLNISNKTDMANWIDNMVDTELADRLRKWMIVNKKDTIKTILLNLTYVKSKGMPIEILAAIDSKRLVLELTKAFRMISETLGYYIKEDKLLMELGY